jgi:hypothetical protein
VRWRGGLLGTIWFLGVRSLASCLGEDPETAAPRTDTDASAGGAAGEAAAGDAPGSIDGSTPRCDLGKPFAAPAAISWVNPPAAEFHPHVSQDELRMHLLCNVLEGGGPLRVCLATRSTPQDPWVLPGILAGGWNDGQIGEFSLSDDELTMVYSRAEPSSPGPPALPTHDLRMVTRTTREVELSGERPLVAVNQPGRHEAEAWILSDGSAIYYLTRSGAPDYVFGVARAQRLSDGVYGQEQPSSLIGGVPVVVRGETMAFTNVNGALDIGYATRGSSRETFTPSEALIVASLNSGRQEWPSWASDDGCVIYLMSDRGDGRLRIYRASRPL